MMADKDVNEAMMLITEAGKFVTKAGELFIEAGKILTDKQAHEGWNACPLCGYKSIPPSEAEG